MPPADTPTSMSPPLKWAGGKRWQVPHLLPMWQPHTRRRLVEPFAVRVPSSSAYFITSPAAKAKATKAAPATDAPAKAKKPAAKK